MYVEKTEYVKDPDLHPIPGVKVTIRNRDDTLAIIYDRADEGTAVALDNPLTTDIYGAIKFYAPVDTYEAEYRYAGRLIRKDDMTVGDPFDIDAALAEVQANAAAAADSAAAAAQSEDEIEAMITALSLYSPPYNAADIGYDIILKIGQSNESGYGTVGYDAAIDNVVHPRVFMLPDSGAAPNTIQPAAYPMPEAMAGGAPGPTLAAGYGLAFAKLLVEKIPTNRSVLELPLSKGSTGYSNNHWNPGDDLYENAVAKANAAIALGANNRLVLIEWLGGEADDGAYTKAQYAAKFDAMIAGLRARITGAARVPIVVGQMVPEVYQDFASPIDLAHQQTPQRLERTAFWFGTRGNQQTPDNYHYDAIRQRTNAARALEAYPRAIGNVIGIVPTAPLNFTMTAQGVGSVTFTWRRPNERITSWKLRYRRKAVGGAFTTVSFAAELDSYKLGGLYSAGGSAVYEAQLLGVNESGDGFATELLDIAPLTAVTPILDTLGVSAGRAFGLVKLRAAYAGNSLKVRRSSDNALADIPFLAGGITDFEALMNHVTVGGTVPNASGYVRTQYSHDGAAHDRIQTTNANQPRIVNAGVLCTYNGAPGIEYYDNAGTATYLVAAAGGPIASDLTIVHAGTVSPANSQYALTHDPYGGTGGPEIRWGDRFNYGFYGQGFAQTGQIILKEVAVSLAATFDNTAKTAALYVAGAAQSLTITTPFTTTSPAVAGGQTGAASGGHAFQYIGKQFEELVLPAKLTAGQAATLSAYHATLYGTGAL